MFPLLTLLACITADDIDARLDADGDGHRQDVDCDENNPAIHPEATEVCNGVDDDCDGSIDGAESQDAVASFTDADGDGFGGPAGRSCPGAERFTEVGGDCDDGEDAVHPNATEVCNGVDDDCDGVIDGPASDDAALGFDDVDDDGFGANTRSDCPTAAGWTALGGDCDDNDDGVHPNANERCNAVDDDCDGVIDGTDSADAVHGFLDCNHPRPPRSVRACPLRRSRLLRPARLQAPMDGPEPCISPPGGCPAGPQPPRVRPFGSAQRSGTRLRRYPQPGPGAIHARLRRRGKRWN